VQKLKSYSHFMPSSIMLTR